VPKNDKIMMADTNKPLLSSETLQPIFLALDNSQKQIFGKWIENHLKETKTPSTDLQHNVENIKQSVEKKYDNKKSSKIVGRRNEERLMSILSKGTSLTELAKHNY
jgi:hypothetical protein